ncbi:hypothetical protein BCIN_14g00050 [Botrytis cinerea B05.10]|uniref:Uncharacterized protein n=1 Tax=Botryotinia fuckeliana (strain B05.10) TaxID=332648 RepID=A0A384K1V2_BOTFB|nr:hypothetical protein BCIN_14g00050 [Botrytis cinerea B05.10]ATZ56761.1 hypothetical protein BCIN_14g00050 [Botrytis cinerea B05.10]
MTEVTKSEAPLVSSRVCLFKFKGITKKILSENTRKSDEKMGSAEKSGQEVQYSGVVTRGDLCNKSTLLSEKELGKNELLSLEEIWDNNSESGKVRNKNGFTTLCSAQTLEIFDNLLAAEEYVPEGLTTKKVEDGESETIASKSRSCGIVIASPLEAISEKKTSTAAEHGMLSQE